MPWNVFIFPIAAGYYLLTRLNCFKFRQQRLDRQRLIFDTIVVGIALLIIAEACKDLAVYFFPALINKIYSYFPLDIPHVGTTSFTLILAFAGAKLGNLTIYRDVSKQVEKAIKKVGNEMEMLLLSSNKDHHLLQFTLGSGKFYVGWVKDLPVPHVANYVRIIPAFSGYRDDEKRLIFTTEYISVYKQIIDTHKQNETTEHPFDLVIKLGDISTIARFDIDLYERFNEEGIKNTSA